MQYRFAAPSQMQMAADDLAESIRLTWFWSALSWNDIRQRYRGSMLGPFWLTLTTAAFIVGLGPLYATLFKLDINSYLPYLAVGITTWSFISGTIIDSSNTFVAAGDTIKQIRLPRLAVLFQVVWRNVIVFAHNIPIYLVVFLWFQPQFGWANLLVIPGFALVTLNLVWIALVVAILCARFRDITPIVASLMQMAFFLTPVMWNLKDHNVSPLLVGLNPFAAYIELIRAPLLGHAPQWVFVLSALGTLVLGSLLAFRLFVRARRRIVYWV